MTPSSIQKDYKPYQKTESHLKGLTKKQKLKLQKAQKINQQFVAAAKKDDPNFLNKLLKGKNIQIDTVDADGHTALFYMAAKGNTEAVKILISHGANVQWKGSQAKRTPLERALKNGNEEINSIMLAKVSDQIENKNRLLIFAAQGGDVKALRILLEDWKLPVNFCDEKGLSPLHYAARSHHVDCVKLLIKHGADIQATCKGRTPLFEAVESEDLLITKALIDAGAPVNPATGQCSVIHEAASVHNVSLMQLLEQAGAKLDRLDSDNCNPLHIACENENEELIDFLLQKNNDVNQKNCDGDTPLHFACFDDNPEIVKKLIQAGADINAENELHETPLYVALRSRSYANLKTLLIHGALISVNENSYLVSAIEHKDKKAVKFITSYAKDQIPNERKAFQLAVNSQLFDYAELMIQAGFNPFFHVTNGRFTPMHVVTFAENIRGIEFLSKVCPSLLEEKDACDSTPLQLAFKENKTKAAKVLVQKGAVVNIADQNGRTPLHFAAAFENLEAVKFLLEAKADPNQKNASHHTPLHFAADSISIHSDKIIELLLAFGADKTIKDLNGHDALSIAKRRNNTLALEALNFVKAPSLSRDIDTDKKKDKELKLTRHQINDQLRNSQSKQKKWNPVEKESKNARKRRERNLSEPSVSTARVSQNYPSVRRRQSTPPQVELIPNENEVVQASTSSPVADLRRPEDGVKYVKTSIPDGKKRISRKKTRKVPEKLAEPISEKGKQLLFYAKKHFDKVTSLLESYKQHLFSGSLDKLTVKQFERAAEYHLLKLFESLHPTNSHDFAVDEKYLEEVHRCIIDKDLALKFRNMIRHETHDLGEATVFNIGSLLQKAELKQKIKALEKLQRKNNPITDFELKGLEPPKTPLPHDLSLNSLVKRIETELELVNETISKVGKDVTKFDTMTKNALKMSLSYLGTYLKDLRIFSDLTNPVVRRTIFRGIQIGHYTDSNVLEGKKDLTKDQLSQFLQDKEAIMTFLRKVIDSSLKLSSPEQTT